MRIIILTSSRYDTASYHLPLIINEKSFTVAMVVLCEGEKVPKKKMLIRKLKKLTKIGLFGALNGLMIRKWFNLKKNEYLEIEDIEDICFKENIPFQKVPSINHQSTFEIFNKAKYDLGVSLGNGYIPKNIFQSPKFGMINVHHEILPEFQNAQSVIWQLYNGSKFTGYSIHRINRFIDKGEILYQAKIPIAFMPSLEMTVKKTIAILQLRSSQGLIKVLSDFNRYDQNAKPQYGGSTYTTPSLIQFLKIVRNFRKLKRLTAFNIDYEELGNS